MAPGRRLSSGAPNGSASRAAAQEAAADIATRMSVLRPSLVTVTPHTSMPFVAEIVAVSLALVVLSILQPWRFNVPTCYASAL